MSAPIFDEGGNPVGASGAAPAVLADSGEPSFQAMSLDDARAAMVREHGVALGKDDPILLSVTLHQGFCADLDKLLQHHRACTQTMLKATGDGYAEAVERTLESLKDKTVKASLDQSFALIQAQAEAMQTLHRRMRRFGLLISASTVVAALSCGLVFAFVSQLIQ